MPEVLQYDFMVRAMLAAVLVGLAAPTVGVFLVQRRLSLIGDGMGHVALTGVAVALVTNQAEVEVALVLTVLAAVAVELLRRYGRTAADVVLAVLFYGGIAGGVVVISLDEGGSTATLNTYLFGAITTTSREDLQVSAVLAVVVLVTALGLGRRLAAVSSDEEHARASGLPVTGLNVLLGVLTAVTVVLSMRVVGLLLISALMILPVAVSQQLSRSFRATTTTAMVVGVGASLAGVVGSWYADTPSGGTIVLLLIALFVLAAAGSALLRLGRSRGHRRRARAAGGVDGSPRPGGGDAPAGPASSGAGGQRRGTADREVSTRTGA
ncbi:metal ABC transporter permease [Pseudokineococcus sp. 1T1Z-3]|uniref:metal ABC transporter permease n=1 Tax=Pseudokineococcus sp. 1T1Z-3 TaxID=3132745 RepID=UPI0030B00641